MAKKVATPDSTQTVNTTPEVSPEKVAEQALANGSGQQLFDALAKALSQAIITAKGPEKKTFATRKPGDPWRNKDGSPKTKLKRNMFQHGIKIDPELETSETISLLNELKPGRYLNDWVKVYKRKDQGIDIDYPIKTASQRMRLSHMGIHGVLDESGKEIKSGFTVLLERMVAEGKKPKASEYKEDLD